MVNIYNKSLNKYARENRQAGNLSEALLWNQLKKKQLGYSLTKQKPIGNYIADFYCKELKLIIEIDGDSHNYKINYDKLRDDYMAGVGIKVLRIDDLDVKTNLEGVMILIKEKIKNVLEPSPARCATPPSEGN